MTYTGINDILTAFFSKLKTWLKANITKSYVGLGNVDNTADSAKSVKYATSAGSATTATSATSATSATTASTCTGNSATATKLQTARSISITDGTNTGTASTFDGSENVSLKLPSKIKATSFVQGGAGVLDSNGVKGKIEVKGSYINTTPYIKLATISMTSSNNIDYRTHFRLILEGCGQRAWCDFEVNARIVQGTSITFVPQLNFISSYNTAISIFLNNIDITYSFDNSTLNMALWVKGDELHLSSWFNYYLIEKESTTADYGLFLALNGNFWNKIYKGISNRTGDASSLPDTVGIKQYKSNYFGQLVIPTTSSTTNGAIWIG